MSVRLRITLLFAIIVMVILLMVCGSVYYFSYTSRLHTIKTRLTNWAITTGRLLSQSGLFDQQMILKIDASTTLAMKNKTVQAFDPHGNRIYIYSDISADTLTLDKAIVQKALNEDHAYFADGNREGISYHFNNKNFRLVLIAAAYDQEGLKKLQQLRVILTFSFLGGLLIAIIGGYFFSKRLLIPLRKIADEVNQISAHNLAERIKTGREKDEWHYLSTTLNQLLNRLQRSFDTHRRFISNASHELLTPLTSISSQLEISLHRDREALEYQSVMGSVYQDVQRLSKLTQTLLEFARASGDPGGLEIDLVRMDEILLALPAEMSRLNENYGVKLHFEGLPDEEERLIVLGNPELLSTAIRNIVINACKYSPDHQAEISLSCQQHAIHLFIKDNGPGIPDSEKENIFQPFYRTDDHPAQQGFGLGLSLARQIIKLHKGSISLQSDPHTGTLFCIVLPDAESFLLHPSHLMDSGKNGAALF